MNKNLRVLMTGLLLAAMTLLPAAGSAQDKPHTPAAKNPTEKPATSNARPSPFRGKVAAVDQQAKTVKVGERTFHIASQTRVLRGNRPATLDEVKVGEVVSGNYTRSADGKLTAKLIRIGPKPHPEGKPAQKNKTADKQKAAAE